MLWNARVSNENYIEHASRPKALSSIREQRLASKQELKAVRHVLQVAGIELDDIFPARPLRPVDPAKEQRLFHTLDGKRMAYIASKEDNTARWDTIGPSKHLRLVLSPDEGGPLFCGFQWLAYHNGCVALNRDPLFLVCNLSEIMTVS